MKRIMVFLVIALLIAGCAPTYQDPNPQPPRPMKGNPQAAVVVEEFADYQCPACSQANALVKELEKQFNDTVLWKYFHFPLTQIHPYALNAAMAAECANDQGKFWEYHDMLYEHQQDLSRLSLIEYASQIGLDKDALSACIQSRTKYDEVQDDLALGKSKGVDGTPTFFANGTKVQNWTELERIIQSKLSPAVPTSSETN